MQLGMIGLGRMGANMVARLMHAGHECVVYDLNPDVVNELAGQGAVGSNDLDDLISKLDHAAQRLDHGARGLRRRRRSPISRSGSSRATSIIDGGNSYYRDDIRRARGARAARASTTSTSARAAASSVSTAATA